MRIFNSLTAIGSILFTKTCHGYNSIALEERTWNEPGMTGAIEAERIMNVEDDGKNATQISPSISPSMAPIETTSIAPTTTISSNPSVSASYDPSSMPSATPTRECHDLESYRSPLNKLTCRDHRNTDCSMWKYLGLTDEDVLDLYRSCPVSCSVDCG